MPVTEFALTSFVQKFEVSDAERDCALLATDEMDKHLRTWLSSFIRGRKWSVHRVIRAGSINKGTALRCNFDVDLVVLMNMPVDVYLLDEKQGVLKDALWSCLQSHGAIEIDVASWEQPYPSLSCRLSGLVFDVFVGVRMGNPVACDGNEAAAQLRALQDLALASHAWSDAMATARRLASTCVESVDSVIRNESATVRRCIMLMKYWRMAQGLPSFKSFFAEVVVLNAAHHLRLEAAAGVGRSGGGLRCRALFARSLKLLDFSGLVASKPRVLRSDHLGLYDEEAWGSWIAGAGGGKRLVVVNPALPLLDVTFSVQPAHLWEWSDAANETLAVLEDPHKGLQDIFGVSAPPDNTHAAPRTKHRRGRRSPEHARAEARAEAPPTRIRMVRVAR